VSGSSPPQSFWPEWGQAGWRLNRGVEAERSQVGTRVRASRFYTAGDRQRAGAGTIDVDANSYLSATPSPDTSGREEIIMTAPKLTRVLGGVFIVAALVAIPTQAAAQTTTVQNLFADVLLPNPCNGGDPVMVSGTETIVISSKITGAGQLHLDISDVSKGSGISTIDLTRTYTFSDNEQFSVNATLPFDPLGLNSFTFTQKLFLKGAKSLDNWVVRASFVLQINQQGIVTKGPTNFASGVCKG